VSLCLCGFPFVAAAHADEPQIKRQESVAVDRVVVDVRVLDGGGRAIPGLSTEQFALEVDGREVAIESVRWVDDTGDRAAALPAEADEGEAPPPVPDRLLLLLFQKDLKGSRGEGLLRMQRYACDMIRGFGAHDRVAVASHDGTLHLWLDFTTDREAAVRALSDAVLFGHQQHQEEGDGPSLRATLDADEARNAATPERAVKLLADGMASLPGTKTMILFGWGMGELTPVGVRMTHEYGPAVEALARAGMSVFALDLTNADYHSLEAGLQQVAGDTGGTYARTHIFPGNAVRQLEAALAGHYVLSFQRPDLPRGEHRMHVRLRGARGTALARTTYLDPE
jgi:VWFA-related protein